MPLVCSNHGRSFLSACALLAFSLVAGCSVDEPAVAVSSERAAGVLARLDYDDGASVEFRQSGDGVSVAGVAPEGSVQPLDGLALAAPGELFEALTGAPAPTALRAAASPTILDPFTCDPSADFCAVNQQTARTVRSGARVDGVVGRLQVTSGSLRLRVLYAHSGSDRVLLDLITGPIDRPIHEFVPRLDRNMRVEITEVRGATYFLWLDWRD